MLEKAFAHNLGEMGLHTLWESLKADYESIRKGHDSIHEFILLAPLMFPREGGPSWHRHSAFLLYHWEIGDAAHRSLLEALCGYYNPGFTLLRTALELGLKGALYEGLAHCRLRSTSQVLEKDEAGRNLKAFLEDLMPSQSPTSDELEETSAAIYDKIEPVVHQRRYQPSFKTILAQLSEWGLLDRTEDVDNVRDAYMRLSKDVHVLPDYTDIGRVLTKGSAELFEPRAVNQAVLHEYLVTESFVMDMCATIELNILKENLKFHEVKSNLSSRFQYLKDLGMANTLRVAKRLLG
jgi:hypothetical protein